MDKKIINLERYFHIQKKGWGKEIFVFHPKTKENLSLNRISVDLEVETVKLLIVEKNKKGSIHFHLEKNELFICSVGMFEITFIENGIKTIFNLKPFESVFVPKGLVHQIKGLEENNILLEISSLDKPEDSYRIEKGD